MKTPDPRLAPTLALALALLAAAFALGGCIYRPTIQQGNLLSVEDVDQVQVGMTRSQVRYLLGTPMISDPFAPHRWDYVYRLTHGRNRKVETAHFLVRFEGDTVTAVEKIDAPEPRVAEIPQDKPKAPDASREPPPPPSIRQPEPDSPRPKSN